MSVVFTLVQARSNLEVFEALSDLINFIASVVQSEAFPLSLLLHRPVYLNTCACVPGEVGTVQCSENGTL